MNYKRLRCNFSVGLVLLLAGGCGAGSNLRGVSGDVTYEGKPIAEGTIEFTPVEGTPGALAGAVIRDGKYEVPQHHGVLGGGVYKIVIVAMKDTGRTIPGMSDRDGKPLKEFANYIPAHFSSASKLTVTISGDEANEFNLHLLNDGIDVEGNNGTGGRIHFDGP